ncbi:uncharacterized protein METZ01_LOCUS354852, partial [marine metagenome]
RYLQPHPHYLPFLQRRNLSYRRDRSLDLRGRNGTRGLLRQGRKTLRYRQSSGLFSDLCRLRARRSRMGGANPHLHAAKASREPTL